MHKYYLRVMFTICVIFMAGCQTPVGQHLFTSPSTDTSITTAVLEAMLTNDTISTLNIHVETTNGIVSLSGYVKTIRQSDTSEEVARKTPGVKSVQNNIIVRK